MDIKSKITTTTTETTEIKLTGENILNLLRDTGCLKSISQGKVTFRVPGGGDYSNETLEIDEEDAIYVSVTEVTVK